MISQYHKPLARLLALQTHEKAPGQRVRRAERGRPAYSQLVKNLFEGKRVRKWLQNVDLM
jgi:hypothetical protein